MDRGALWRIAVLVLALVVPVCAAEKKGITPEERTGRYMESVRGNVPLLTAFLKSMPKGGDLHNHLTGSIYAESLIRWAGEANLCVATDSMQLSAPPCDEAAGTVPVTRSSDDLVLYRRIVDAWSMRNWKHSGQSGHDHFFDSFDKFLPATVDRTGDMLAEVATRAAANHEQYQELMLNPTILDGVVQKTGWIENFGKMREALLANGLREAVSEGSRNLDIAESRREQLLRCKSTKPDQGCRVTQRYIYQVLRGLSRESVFTQIVAGFEMASRDSRVVGLNLVMPEDHLIPMRDYELHMRMIDFLKPSYPSVHITLHAGELALGLVPPEGLRFHVRQAIELGHAERIGHGVDVLHDDRPAELMREMAKRNVMVEINLTSNDVILGVSGKDHPLRAYIQHDVPVALSTDDEGVARSEMTQEYLKAVLEQDLSYSQLKRMARTSLRHAFLPGESLWADSRKNIRVNACTVLDSTVCRKYVGENDKARIQWELEKELIAFEARW